jgi:sugar lactone lactonase YvrE
MSFSPWCSFVSVCLSSSSFSNHISGSRSRAVRFGGWAKLGGLCLLLLAGGQRLRAQSGIATYAAPSTLVGSTTTNLTANVTITAAGTSAVVANNPVRVLTQGVAGLDFTLVTGGTCAASTGYNVGDVCSVEYSFTPTHPWSRFGGVEVVTDSGVVLGGSYLTGMGNGPQTTFGLSTPTAPSLLGGGFYEPTGVAVDAGGNVYVVDQLNKLIKKMPVGCLNASCTTTLGGGLNLPTGIAVDGLGNVYVADPFAISNLQVVEIPVGCANSSCMTVLGGGFIHPTSIAVDGSGNVYVGDHGTSTVTMMPAGCLSSSCVTAIGGGYSNPQGVAVDTGGNVYVADQPNKTITKIVPGCTNVNCVVTIGGGFSAPVGVAVDGSGNVYVTDVTTELLTEIPAGCLSASCVVTLGSGYSYPAAIALDGSGNFYVSDQENNELKKIDVQDAPSLSFADTTVGSSSAQQVVTLGNNGNLPLTISALTGTNASFGAATSCSASGDGATVAAGGTCALGVELVPAATGPGTGSTSITDNTLNTGATQTIALIGTGLGTGGTAQTITFPAPTAIVANGVAPITLTATASSTLAVYYTITGPATLSGSRLTITGAGTVAVIAHQDGDATYAPAPSVTQSIFVSSGAVQAVAASGSFTATMTFTSAVTLNSTLATAIQVTTQGVTGLDFAYVAGGTGACAKSGSYSSTKSCTVKYTFKPTHPWARYGGIQLTDGSGNVVSSILLSGTGTGPQVTFNLSTAVPVARPAPSPNYSRPRGIAVDAAGDIFVADDANVAVYEVSASGTVTTVGNGDTFAAPYAVAVDGAGNVYVTDVTRQEVTKMPKGCLNSNCNVQTSDPIFSGPVGIAVDGSGNVYVSDADYNRIVMLPPGCFTDSCSVTLGGGFSAPYGVAVDKSGNVYVADSENHAVKEIPQGCLNAGCVVTLGGGFTTPDGVAVDGVGNVYVADVTGFLGTIPPNCFSAGCVTTTSNGFTAPFGVAIDGSGNLYVSDSGVLKMYKIDVSDAPTITFLGSTFAGRSTAQQVVTVGNNGNMPLTISTLTFAPAPPTAFFNDAGAGTTCSAGGTVAAGASCGLGIEYAPPAVGDNAGTLKVKDNTLNATTTTAQTQTISLNGTAIANVPDTTTTTVGLNPASVASGGATMLNAAVADTATPATQAAGSVTFYDTVGSTTTTLGSATVTSGVASLSYNTTTPGANTITAAFTPTSTILFAASSDTTGQVLTVIPVVPTTVTLGAVSTAADSTTGITVTATESGSAGVVTGGIVTFGTSGSVGGSFNPATCALTVAGTCTTVYTPSGTLAVGSYSGDITASFAAVGNYAAASATGNLSVTAASNVWVQNTDDSLSEFRGDGTAVGSTPVVSGGTGTSTGGGVAFDSGGNVWSVNSTTNQLLQTTKTGASATTFAGGGLNTPVALAVDGNGVVWIANQGGSVSAFANTGIAVSPATTGYAGGTLNAPTGIAIDVSGNVWISNGGNNTTTEILGGAAPVAPLAVGVQNGTPGVKP